MNAGRKRDGAREPRKPLPHPDLLRLHAALSRVVRMAGRGDFDYGDWEEEEDDLVQCDGPALPPDQIGWLAGARDRILFRDFRTGQMVSSTLL